MNNAIFAWQYLNGSDLFPPFVAIFKNVRYRMKLLWTHEQVSLYWDVTRCCSFTFENSNFISNKIASSLWRVSCNRFILWVLKMLSYYVLYNKFIAWNYKEIERETAIPGEWRNTCFFFVPNWYYQDEG